ncbi:hypothetical protein MTO96_013004 [Rhipicephalus appendiculatus]
MFVNPGADCEMNEAENAGGKVNVDAQVQSCAELCSKATQVALKGSTKAAKVQTSQSLKEVDRCLDEPGGCFEDDVVYI